MMPKATKNPSLIWALLSDVTRAPGGPLMLRSRSEVKPALLLYTCICISTPRTHTYTQNKTKQSKTKQDKTVERESFIVAFCALWHRRLVSQQPSTFRRLDLELKAPDSIFRRLQDHVQDSIDNRLDQQGHERLFDGRLHDKVAVDGRRHCGAAGTQKHTRTPSNQFLCLYSFIHPSIHPSIQALRPTLCYRCRRPLTRTAG